MGFCDKTAAWVFQLSQCWNCFGVTRSSLRDDRSVSNINSDIRPDTKSDRCRSDIRSDIRSNGLTHSSDTSSDISTNGHTYSPDTSSTESGYSKQCMCCLLDRDQSYDVRSLRRRR